MKTYGKPFLSQSTLRMTISWRESGTRKRGSMPYARYLMEQHLGRELTDEEEVDHIDNNGLNDKIENLQILTPIENFKKFQSTLPKANCAWCNGEFQKNCANGRFCCYKCYREFHHAKEGGKPIKRPTQPRVATR